MSQEAAQAQPAQEEPAPEFKDLTDEEYKNMTRKSLYKRARELVDMCNKQGEKAEAGNNINMIIYIGLKNEAQKYIKNKRGQEPKPKQIERLVKTIYKNLMKQEDIKLDVEWIKSVVFKEKETIGVDRMYERLERVNALIEKFSGKQEN